MLLSLNYFKQVIELIQTFSLMLQSVHIGAFNYYKQHFQDESYFMKEISIFAYLNGKNS